MVGGFATASYAYTQKSSTAGGPQIYVNDGTCHGYGYTDADIHSGVTGKVSGAGYLCDYVQVRVLYSSGTWAGYSNWKTGATYAIQTVGSGTVSKSDHGVDSWH